MYVGILVQCQNNNYSYNEIIYHSDGDPCIHVNLQLGATINYKTVH